MPHENLESLMELRDSMDRLGQRVEASQTKMTSTRGQDESGLIAVRLDAEGRFVDVRILEAWVDEYEPGELGAAVVAAFTSATMARMEQWGAGLEEQASEPEPQTRPTPSRDQELADQLEALLGNADIDAETAMQGLLGQLQEMEGMLDAAVGSIGRDSQTSVPGFDGGRKVRASADLQGGVTEVVIDEGFAEDSHAFNISRAVTEAITNAITDSVAQAAHALGPIHDLNAVAERMQDPRRLANVIKPGTTEN